MSQLLVKWHRDLGAYSPALRAVLYAGTVAAGTSLAVREYRRRTGAHPRAVGGPLVKSTSIERAQLASVPGSKPSAPPAPQPAFPGEAIIKKAFNDLADIVQQKTGLTRSAAVAVSFGAVSCVLSGIATEPLANLAGFAYPLYASYKALKSVDKADDSQWLTYWIVYGSFALAESLTGSLFKWLPMYHVFKVIFLVWCFLPQTRGAEVVYSTTIEPFLSRYEARIDSQAEALYRRSSQLLHDASSAVQDNIIASAPSAPPAEAPKEH